MITGGTARYHREVVPRWQGLKLAAILCALSPACSQAWPTACEWSACGCRHGHFSPLVSGFPPCAPLKQGAATLGYGGEAWQDRHQNQWVLGSWLPGQCVSHKPLPGHFCEIRVTLCLLLSYYFCNLLLNLILANTDIKSEICKKVTVSLLLATDDWRPPTAYSCLWIDGENKGQRSFCADSGPSAQRETALTC